MKNHLEMNVYDVRSSSCFESIDRCFNTKLDGENLVLVWSEGAVVYLWFRHMSEQKPQPNGLRIYCWFRGEEQIFESE